MTRVHLLGQQIWFPKPESAHESGVVAVGGDLSPDRLLLAYRSGIFPWFNDGEPILWWCPDPRFVLEPAKLKIRRSLRKVLRQGNYQVRYDTQFEAVIDYCRNLPRQGQEGTWITSEMRAAYLRFHQMGFAHSVETFFHDQLVGGLYGVAIGPFFFGESMFHLKPDASKIALAALARRYFDAPFIDCQIHNNFFESMGAGHISRSRFLKTLRQNIDRPNRWTHQPPPDLSASSW